MRPIFFGAALVALLLTPAAASAAESSASLPLLGYWQEFLDHWTGSLRRQNGVVMLALGVGAVALIIITRGKWRK